LFLLFAVEVASAIVKTPVVGLCFAAAANNFRHFCSTHIFVKQK